MKKCVIIGAGSFYGHLPRISEEDYVIAADGGCRYCEMCGITPDLAIGDMDSLEEVPEDYPFKQLPVKKDDTDTLAAIRLGLRKRYEKFHIIAGTGGRTDHTIANMQCLVFLSKQGKAGFLYDERLIITAITDSSIVFPEDAEGIVSVFAAGDSALGVNERGLKYSLNDADLTNSFPIGVSNSFKGEKSRISVKSGTLFVTFPIDVKCQILFENKKHR
ncbi:MAG: thiamine diphosphokinase [Bacteroides sp.]|nr:thiamine diphosphokinase [Bacteroides sp.]